MHINIETNAIDQTRLWLHIGMEMNIWLNVNTKLNAHNA